MWVTTTNSRNVMVVSRESEGVRGRGWKGETRDTECRFRGISGRFRLEAGASPEDGTLLVGTAAGCTKAAIS